MRITFGFSVLVLCGSAWSQTVTLGATADARILGLFGGSNFGTDLLSTFRSGGNNQNTVIRFDVGVLPADQVITGATLRLYGSRFGGSDTGTTINVWRLTEGFDESFVTWNSRSSLTPWSLPGGSFLGLTGSNSSNPYAFYSGLQPTGWYEFDVTTLVAQWYTGLFVNHGFALTGQEGNSLVYTSREGAGPVSQFRPELVVRYEPVPEPLTLLALASGAAAVAWTRRRPR